MSKIYIKESCNLLSKETIQFKKWSLHTVFHSDSISLHYHQHCTRVPFSLHPPQYIICDHFDDSNSDRCEMIPHRGFRMHISDD